MIIDLYSDVCRLAPKPDRPYVFVNMIATIDGKIVSGEIDEPVGDLGTATDRAVMKVLQEAADAILIGAGTLRATPIIRYPRDKIRLVVSRTGDVPAAHTFFTDAPTRSYVVSARPVVGLNTLVCDGEGVAFASLLHRLRREHGVQRLLCEGGSELNAQLFAADLVDEIFVTIAPKVKLGRSTPTLAGGEPLPRASLLLFELVECHPIDNEVFLRYRRQERIKS